MHLADARARAERLDTDDPIGHARSRFALPPGVVYLDGNSLGALPAHVPDVVSDVVRNQWGHGLVGSWNEHAWWDAPERVGALVAPLIGAASDEVVVADSTSVNLFKVLVAAARLRPQRRVLVVEPTNFPSDLYIVAAVAELLGLDVRQAEPRAVDGVLDDDVAAVCFSHVDFQSGRVHDMRTVTHAAHGAGALMVWDLCHSAGVLEIELDACGVDFAVGCGYKYLNGGPGAPAYVMASRRHLDVMRQPIPGWTGHARPFDMEPGFERAPGIASLRAGTPPIVSLLTMEAALGAYDGVEMRAVRAKSLSLTRLFLELADVVLHPLGFEVATPRADEERGSQVALRHPDAYGVVQALIARRVIGDFRAPNVVRLGFAPLYVRHVDVVTAVEQAAAVVEAGEHRDPAYDQRVTVT